MALCGLDLTAGLGPSDFEPTLWEWTLYGGGAVGFVSACRYLSRPPARVGSPAAAPTATSVEDLVRDWPKLERWMRSERPAEDDLLGHRRIARRLAEYLLDRGGTVGLEGPLGCGKSSVVAWLKDDVGRARRPGQPEVWFAEQSCWGFEDSGAAV